MSWRFVDAVSRNDWRAAYKILNEEETLAAQTRSAVAAEKLLELQKQQGGGRHQSTRPRARAWSSTESAAHGPLCPHCGSHMPGRYSVCGQCRRDVFWTDQSTEGYKSVDDLPVLQLHGAAISKAKARELLENPDPLLEIGAGKYLPRAINESCEHFSAAIESCRKNGIDITPEATVAVITAPNLTAAQRVACKELLNSIEAARLARVNLEAFLRPLEELASQVALPVRLPVALQEAVGRLSERFKQVSKISETAEDIGPFDLLLQSLACVAVADRRVSAGEAQAIAKILGDHGFPEDKEETYARAIAACKAVHAEGVVDAWARLNSLLLVMKSTQFAKLVCDLQEKLLRVDGEPKAEVEEMCTRFWSEIRGGTGDSLMN